MRGGALTSPDSHWTASLLNMSSASQMASRWRCSTCCRLRLSMGLKSVRPRKRLLHMGYGGKWRSTETLTSSLVVELSIKRPERDASLREGC